MKSSRFGQQDTEMINGSLKIQIILDRSEEIPHLSSKDRTKKSCCVGDSGVFYYNDWSLVVCGPVVKQDITIAS